ncbi:MAG: hypothetical protein CMD14_00380 [Flavobacteriales bacterium]|nr:hypothetical protein [Flavobacteriales bacterium]
MKKLLLYLICFPFCIVAQEISYFDGKAFLTYYNAEVEVSINLSKERQYGKYYIADIGIYNNTNQSFNFNPSDIKATIIRKGKAKEGEVLSHKEYMKKVKTSQTWQAIGKSIAEHSAAADAGKTTTNTSSSTYGSYSGSSRTNYSDNYGRNIGSSRSTGNFSGTSTTNSTSTTIDGGAQYMASQNADRNVKEFTKQQSNISNMLNQGYLKRNTLKNQDYIRGNINIKYRKADEIEIVVPINGVDYIFLWDKDMLNEI